MDHWPPLSDNQLEAASLSKAPIVHRLIADLRANRAEVERLRGELADERGEANRLRVEIRDVRLELALANSRVNSLLVPEPESP